MEKGSVFVLFWKKESDFEFITIIEKNLIGFIHRLSIY